MSRFLGRRDDGPAQLGDDLTIKRATDRAEMMSTGELTTWVESISSTVAVQVGSYSIHHDGDALYEARRPIEILHALLTVLISRP
jgi:hypothetical protein